MIKCFRDLLPDSLIGIVYSFVGQDNEYFNLQAQYKQKILLTYGIYNGRHRCHNSNRMYPIYLLLNDKGKMYRKFRKNIEQYSNKIWYASPKNYIPYKFLLDKDLEILDILKNKRIFNLI